MSTAVSATLASASPHSLGSSNKHDPALKPNPHPYAIKTTHTALLSRSNSSGHNSPSKYFYVPSAGTSPRRHVLGYRGHRYSTSLTGEPPSPLPSPLPSPTHSQRSESEDDAFLRRPRADTLPTYLADGDHTLSTEPKEDLPLNPKTWTPTQLSVYLTRMLRIRSGERLPERVARDIASWVRRESVSGRTFLRWTDEDLRLLGVNMLWRSALLTAARKLRQNILRGRIWGNPASDPELEKDQERGHTDAPFGSTFYASSSSSLDLPLTGENPEVGSERRLSRRSRVNINANGRVRGMVDKWERESAGSRSLSRNSSDSGRGRSGSESDDGSEVGEREVVTEDVASDDPASVPGADDEPSIEDLLAAEPAPPVPKDGSWGARAWEMLDAGETMRRMEPHDTVVPRRDASGGSSAGVGSAPTVTTHGKLGNSSRRTRGANNEDPQPARRTAADVFAEPQDTVFTPALAEAGVQVDVRGETELEEEEEAAAALEAKELALESEAQESRALLEEFRRRLEEVEARVSAIEAERHLTEEQQQLQSCQAQGTPAAEQDTHDEAINPEALPKKSPELDTEVDATEAPAVDSERENGSADLGARAEGRLVRHMVDVVPTTVSDLPSYVFLVGLGVCAVVLQVVLKRVGGRSLKP